MSLYKQGKFWLPTNVDPPTNKDDSFVMLTMFFVSAGFDVILTSLNFCIGDMAVYENGVVKMKGRLSVDIIKYGGYKISALEIEDVLQQNPDIQECCVIGVSDITWGQKVVAIVALKPNGNTLTQETLQEWARERLPKHKVPSVFKFVDQIPRNNMGKINKKDITKQYFGPKRK